MGIDFVAVIGHHVPAAELADLATRLTPQAAPLLVRALAELACAANEREAAYEREDTQGRYRASRLVAEEPWLFQYPSEPLFRFPNGMLTTEAQPPQQFSISEEHQRRYPHVEWMEWYIPLPAGHRMISVETAWARDEDVQLIGPAGLRLYFRSRICYLTGGVVRWGAFLDEPRQQEAMRRVCREFASLLGSPVVLYMGDHWSPWNYDLAADYTIEHAIADFLERHGPPATSLADLAAIRDLYDRDGRSTGRGYSPDGYFLDWLSQPLSAD